MPMNISDNAVVLIPARMASTRLPGKPLADIAGKPMIVHVAERAAGAGFGTVAIACCEAEVADAVKSAGYHAIMTKPEHPSGTDRIHEALRLLEAERRESFDIIVNLQGDLPVLDPGIIQDAVTARHHHDADMATLAVEIDTEDEANNPNIVKAMVEFDGQSSALATDFVRKRPEDTWPLYHHVGVYVYTRDALERFTSLPPSPLEQERKLEQMRALENEMTIAVARVDSVPFGVDTPEDLEKARALLAQ